MKNKALVTAFIYEQQNKQQNMTNTTYCHSTDVLYFVNIFKDILA